MSVRVDLNLPTWISEGLTPRRKLLANKATALVLQSKLEGYPPSDGANTPPTPFYIRGRGTQTASGNRGNSERLSSRWRRKSDSKRAVIRNTASYAVYVIGSKRDQAKHMKKRGWVGVDDILDDPKERAELEQTYLDKLLG